MAGTLWHDHSNRCHRDLCQLLLDANVIKTTDPTLDWLSLLISTVGFGSVLYGFSSVGDKGWTDAIVWGTILIGVILIAIWYGARIVWSIRS